MLTCENTVLSTDVIIVYIEVVSLVSQSSYHAVTHACLHQGLQEDRAAVRAGTCLLLHWG